MNANRIHRFLQTLTDNSCIPGRAVRTAEYKIILALKIGPLMMRAEQGSDAEVQPEPPLACFRLRLFRLPL